MVIERHLEALEWYVLPGAPDEGDGTHQRPFASLAAALEGLRATGMSAGRPGRRNVELVLMRSASERSRPGGKPRHQFYIDTRTSATGDGSELAPWPNLDTALEQLADREREGTLPLRPGQVLRITHRDVFVATDFERSKCRREWLAKYVFMMMAIACVLPVLAILSYLTWRAWPALNWEFLTTNPRKFFTAGGIWSPLIGTFFLVLGSLLIAAPIGVLAGVYLNEYARDNWVTRIINLAVVNLAGVPSIVHALFGVGAFVIFMGMGRSLMAASCTVAVMTLPVIITSTREALASVPMSFREACWNMGASKWQTIRTIVLPNSIAGVLTGVILQVSRAAGETAPILFTGAVLFVGVPDSGWESVVPYGPTDRFMALSYHLFALSTQIRGASEETLFGTAVVLIGLVLAVNSVSIGARIYLRSRKKW